MNIVRDKNRFKKLIEGYIKSNIRKFIQTDYFTGKEGKKVIKIPIPQINIPHFKYGLKNTGGVGAGEGNIGDPLNVNPDLGGDKKAGDAPGDHLMEVEITFEELADILAKELNLPRLKPKGRKNVKVTKDKFTGIGHIGPESLKHSKRTFKEALKRSLIEGTFDFKDPKIIPVKEDKRYKTWKTIEEPINQAVIILIQDISGSIDEELKKLIRQTIFWIDVWIKVHYKQVDVVYIVHDTDAKEVNREKFFSLSTGGGTYFSKAYELCTSILKKRFPPEITNAYVFHFSDGENWGNEDDTDSKGYLEKDILPNVNLFCYAEVGESTNYSDKRFSEKVQDLKYDNYLVSKLKTKEGIFQTLIDFLGAKK